MTQLLKDKDDNMLKFNLHRLIIYILLSTIIFFIYSNLYGETIKTDRITTEKRNIIIGLSKREAVEKFGLPHQASEKFWYYQKPEKFWIYFKEPAKLISISIFPEYIETSLNRPVMFKAAGKFSDFTSEDISEQAGWVNEDEEVAVFTDYGVIMPVSFGTTYVFAFQDDIISTIAKLNVTGKETYEERKKIELISVDILPQNSQVSLYRNKLIFKALGTFKNNVTGEYFVKDISDEVVWHSKDKIVATFKENIAYLGRLPDETEIFCSKNEIVSPVQILTLVDTAPVIKERKLESIIILPRTVIVGKDKEVKFRAFGTFNDAGVKEITLDVDWELKNYKIARKIKKGRLLTKEPGITEMQAAMDEISSEPAKLVVFGEPSKPEGAPEKKPRLKKLELAKEKEIEEPSLDEIEKQIENLKEQIASSLRRELKSIQISPSNPEVPKGLDLQFRAKGEYTDGSHRDLTSQVKWQSSNPDVATIEENGMAQSKSIGITLIAASFDKIKSNSQRLTVIAPQLVSISIIPENPTVAINQTIQFEAQGNYTDKSTGDITGEVGWVSYDQNIARFSLRGKLKPQKLGRVEVFAKYGQIESPCQLVTVIAVPVAGILWTIISRLLSLFLFGGIIFLIIIYLRRRMFIQRLRKLMYSNPRSFVIRLYNHLTGVLALYGTVRQKSMAPGEYVSLVKKIYIEKDIDKLVIFSERFNKARYSSHPVDQEMAHAAAGEYNVIIACVMKLHRLRLNFITYLWIIIRKLPLRISD